MSPGRPSEPLSREIELSVGRNRSLTRVIVSLLVTLLTGPWGIVLDGDGNARGHESVASLRETSCSTAARLVRPHWQGVESPAFFLENSDEVGEDGDNAVPGLIPTGIPHFSAFLFPPRSLRHVLIHRPETRILSTYPLCRLRC